MTRGQERFIPAIDAWFAKLGDPHKGELLEQLTSGGKTWQDWMQEHEPDWKEALLELERYVTDRMKEQPGETVRKDLAEQGLRATGLADALIGRAMKELRYYFDAATLREVSLEQFERIAANVITDYFVERRFTTWIRRTEYLGLTEEDAARTCYLVVVNLIHNFYDRNVSLEVLESFMTDELGFSEAKAGWFAELIIRNKEALDRHFLFQRLTKLAKQQSAAEKQQ